MKILIETHNLSTSTHRYKHESKDIKTSSVTDAIKHIENLVKTTENYDYIFIKIPRNNGELTVSVECELNKGEMKESSSYSYSQLLNKLEKRLHEMVSWIDSINEKISLEYLKIYVDTGIHIINYGNAYTLKDEFRRLGVTNSDGKYYSVEPTHPWACENFKLDDVLTYVTKLKRKITSRNSWTNYAKSARELVGGEFDRIVKFIENDNSINRIFNKLQLFAEPSVQGHTGSLFIYDDSGKDRFSTFDIDWEDWNNDMIEMIASSKSKNDFEAKITKYSKDKIAQNS